MDPRLLGRYDDELRFLREMGNEFAQEFPKVAGRLGLQGAPVSDPYVERLLEGCAFLAARVNLKLDAEFPRFTQRLTQILYPHFLAPTPSMLVAQFTPDVNDPALASGVTLDRGTAIHSVLGRNDATACEFRTTQPVRLLPIEIAAASYFTFAPDLPIANLRGRPAIKGGVRIRLTVGGGLRFDQLDVARLPIYLSGGEEQAFRLYELALAHCVGVMVVPVEQPRAWSELLPASCVRPLGFDEAEAALPGTLHGFSGYRLIHEYSAFPQRFLFLELHDLGRAWRRCASDTVEIVLLFSRGEASLEGTVSAANFGLHCAPAINVFEKRCDRIHVGAGTADHHVVGDRTRPMDFEIYDVVSVTGYGSAADDSRVFQPLYTAYHDGVTDRHAYFTMQREPRLLSTQQRRAGARSGYIGSEVFLSLVDADEAPFASDLSQLSVRALVTNRDLPLRMRIGAERSDFTLDASAPVTSIRAIRGPSKPVSGLREGNVAWRLINQLSLNHLTLSDMDGEPGGTALRQMLGLYGLTGDTTFARQLEGIKRVSAQPLVRRLPMPGPIAFGRGLEIELEVDDLAFEGTSPFLFGAIMEQFFARYVSLNSFTETVLRTESRGEVMRWSPRIGERLVV